MENEPVERATQLTGRTRGDAERAIVMIETTTGTLPEIKTSFSFRKGSQRKKSLEVTGHGNYLAILNTTAKTTRVV